MAADDDDVDGGPVNKRAGRAGPGTCIEVAAAILRDPDECDRRPAHARLLFKVRTPRPRIEVSLEITRARSERWDTKTTRCRRSDRRYATCYFATHAD